MRLPTARPRSAPALHHLSTGIRLVALSAPRVHPPGICGIWVRSGKFTTISLVLTSIVAERRLRRIAERRSHHLEIALAKASAASEHTRIELSTAGRTYFIDSADVIRFAGAGDYVEARSADGRTELYDDALARLETALPSDFVRLHRSHIIDTAYVRSLERDPAGTSTLTFVDGSTAPVSRRMMPSLKLGL